MVISKTIAELERMATWRTKSAVLHWRNSPSSIAIAGKSGVAGPSYHPDAARRLDAFARMDIDEAVRIYREDKKSIRSTKVLFVN